MTDARLKEMNVRLKQEKGASSDDADEISFVLVPASSSNPLQELVMDKPSDNSTTATTDPIMDMVEPYFKLQEGETVNLEVLKRQADKEREEGCSSGTCPHVSPTTLRLAAEAGTVERILLKQGNQEDGSIYMYVDESANLKERPINQRAMGMAKNAYAGDIFGDAFIARLQNKKIIVSLGLSKIEKELS
jgi:hypothetical protein